jgi:steroid delta-isomerase-like uncharacterized protein
MESRERDNADVVRRLNASLTARDWEAFGDCLADDCEWTDVPSGGTLRGRDAVIAACKVFTAAFPDFEVESVTLIVQGDLVASEWHGRGTHQGLLPRADGGQDEPTGRRFERTGVGIVEVRDGRIARYRDYFDRLTMTEQLGLGDAS